MIFVKQCKGFDSDKVNMPYTWKDWCWSIKYDGHYMQVHVSQAKGVRFFTSSGKEFYETNLAKRFLEFPDGIYECEFLGKSNGLHGDRKEAAIATTLRTEFAKGIKSNYPGLKCKVFDIISPEPFSQRLKLLQAIPNTLSTSGLFVGIVRYELVGDSPIIPFSRVITDGYEGIYLKHLNHLQREGKRVRSAIKLKQHPTADVVCFDIQLGEGKYAGMIGSLICKDKDGVVVKVGSGLTDEDRSFAHNQYLGKTIEIAYESFSDTYIHPVFKCVRDDK